MSQEDDSLESQYPPDPEGQEAEPDPDPIRARTRRRLERLVRDAVKKGLEAGLGTISKTDEALRGMADVKLPKEVVGFIFSQVDETKNVLVRVVAKEVREFLEATDIATELKRALTALSFEIKTEVRFIPNDSGGVKPVVRASSAPKRGRSVAPPPPDADSAGPEGEEHA